MSGGMEAAQRALDTRALEIATRADQRIASHERECERRQEQIIAKLDDQRQERVAMREEMRGSFRNIYGLLWKSAGALITVLVLALGYFLVRFGLPGEGGVDHAVHVAVPLTLEHAR